MTSPSRCPRCGSEERGVRLVAYRFDEPFTTPINCRHAWHDAPQPVSPDAGERGEESKSPGVVIYRLRAEVTKLLERVRGLELENADWRLRCAGFEECKRDVAALRAEVARLRDELDEKRGILASCADAANVAMRENGMAEIVDPLTSLSLRDAINELNGRIGEWRVREAGLRDERDQALSELERLIQRLRLGNPAMRKTHIAAIKDAARALAALPREVRP